MYKEIALLTVATAAAGCATATAADIVMTLDAGSASPVIELNEKGYWRETYNTDPLFRHVDFGLFRISHCIHAFGGTDVGGGMSYWDGFTLCTSGDNNDYGTLGSSDGWVPEQWGCMAGGGIASVGPDGTAVVEPGAPYLVGYWGYWIEEKEGGEPACQITLNDGRLYSAGGIWVCNHPWPYYGNIHGDGFARPFTEPDDEFALYIHGLDENGNKTGQVVKHVLADVEDGRLRQSPDWHWVDLSALGNIGGIYFTQTSTDSDPTYGMNTACYFCIDRFTVAETEGTARPGRPTGLTLTPSETAVDCAWTAPEGGDVDIYNIYVDGSLLDSTPQSHCRVDNLTPWTDYVIEVRAVDSAGAIGDGVAATVRTTDDTAPDTPANLRVTDITAFSAMLQWDASADNVGVKGYEIWLNDRKVSRSNASTTYALRGLDPDTDHEVRVVALDAAGNRSGEATTVFTTAAEAGIGSVSAGDISVAEVYTDLHGRRVTNPSRGIYLLNGKKVLIK